MELCITNSTRILNLNSLNRTGLPLSVSLKNSTVEFMNQNYFNSQKLSSFSRQIHLYLHQPQFHRSPVRIFASSSSSVALGPEKDRLPADIEVTESPEPNSTVSSPPPSLCLFVHFCLQFLVKFATFFFGVSLYCHLNFEVLFVCITGYFSVSVGLNSIDCFITAFFTILQVLIRFISHMNMFLLFYQSP